MESTATFTPFLVHPFARRQSMTTEAYDVLVEDIRHNGLREPILLHEGMVLDGVNRHRACVDLGTKPMTKKADLGGLTPEEFVARLHAPRINPEYQVHPAAELFPMMSEAEFQALKADIAVNGQIEDVVVWNGQLLDGRHRLRACEELQREATIGELDLDQDPWKYVISHNLHRRHLTTSQRATVAAKLATMRSGERTDLVSNDTRSSLDDAAKRLNVGRATVARAKRVLEHGSEEVQQAVEQGDLPVSTAAELVKTLPDKTEQTKIIKQGAKKVRAAVKRKNSKGSKAPIKPKADTRKWVPIECVEPEKAPPRPLRQVVVEYVESTHDSRAKAKEAAESTERYARLLAAAGFVLGSVDLKIEFHDTRLLDSDWDGRVLLNLPTGDATQEQAAKKLRRSALSENVTQAVAVLPNETASEWFQSLAAISQAICFTADLKAGGMKLNFGGKIHWRLAVFFIGDDVAEFCKAFRKFGTVVRVEANDQ